MISQQFTANGHGAQAESVLRVAIYYRVSQPGQLDAYGYDVQIRLLPEYAERMAWKVVADYREGANSGDGLAHRPEMLRLLADAQLGQFDVILSIEDSRVSRGFLADAEYIKRICDLHSVSLATNAGIYYRPGNLDDDFTTDLRFAFTKREKKVIMQRLGNGRREAARQNGLPHAVAPYGYQFERYGKKGSEKRLVPHERWGDIPAFIFNACAFGIEGVGPVGTEAIGNYLSDVMRVPGPFGGRWNGTHIRRMIRNPAYKGEGLWEGIPVTVLALVTPELWEAANLAVERRNRHGRGRKAMTHPRGILTSFVTCAHCGYIVQHYTKPYRRGEGVALCRAYVCAGHAKHARMGRPPCENGRWNADRLEAAAWEKLVEAVKDPELLLALVEEGERELPDTQGIEPGLIERSLAEIDGKMARVKAAYRNDLLTIEEFGEELGIIRKEREALEDRLAQVGREVEPRAEREAAIRTACDRITQYRKKVEDPNISADGKREVIEGLVEGMTLDRDGNLLITLVKDLAVRKAQVFSEMERQSPLRLG